jgi:carboxypeptidase Q
MLRASWLVSTLVAISATATSAQMTHTVQEQLDLDALHRIRQIGMEQSHIDSLAGHLTDVIGPRLTGSSGMRRGIEWAAEVFRGWGLTNVAIEPWADPFGRGWEQVSYAGRMLEPFVQQLYATPQAWSGSTRGTITCPVVRLEVSDTTELAAYEGRLKGACVLRGAPREIPPEFEPHTRRFDADTLLELMSQPLEAPREQNRQEDRFARFRAQRALNTRVSEWLRTQQVAAILLPSNWTYNVLLTGGHPDGSTARDSAYNPIPALVVSHEQYGILYRNTLRQIPVRLELNVQNRFLERDRSSSNVLAEIRGTDRADEVVMIGAHFDSWHSGTGATDNGAGSVVMMEAMRILETAHLPMRRTIRIGLWTGEEQGLIGSREYVHMHPDELPSISAYLNVDNGTGRLRGIWNQSNPAVNEIFEEILAPVRDLGVLGVRNGNTGGTDHLSFDAAGVPGFNYIQDPIEYSFRTHHSNVDTYERLVLEDLEQAATVVAWTVYTLANREDMMPRKTPTATSGADERDR